MRPYISVRHTLTGHTETPHIGYHSIFGVFIFADDRFTEPTFVEEVAVGRVFTKEELFKTGRRLRARAVALGSIFAVCFTSSPLPDQWPGAFKALARWSGRGLIIMQDSKNRT